VIEALKVKGFTEIQTRVDGEKIVMLRIPSDKWQALIDDLNGDIPFEEADDYGDDFLQ
jgi:hypothetical protein